MRRYSMNMSLLGPTRRQRRYSCRPHCPNTRVHAFLPCACDQHAASSASSALHNGRQSNVTAAQPRQILHVSSKEQDHAVPGRVQLYQSMRSSMGRFPLLSATLALGFGATLPRHVAPTESHLQQVQQARHGGEEQHAVPGRVQLDQHAVQRGQLATAPRQLARVRARRLNVAQVRVVAHLRNRAIGTS